LRIKRIDAGYPLDDHLIKLTELKAGDSVLDGTLGLGADSLVCAHVVGPAGRVIGVESSLPIYALVSEGIKLRKTALEVVHGDARLVLESLPAHSIDCVVLDPMFDQPKKSSAHFELLRKFADHRPLDPVTLAQARRVAKRWVVVKGGRYTKEFDRLGLKPTYTSRFQSTVWARIEPE
jgi:tRNA1(Val) A37 N6-methylase TrmN6